MARVKIDCTRCAAVILLITSLFHQTTGDVGSIVSSDTFNAIFPNKNSFYTYDAFTTAAGSFSSFGSTAQDVAAFFANVYHETTGLQFIDEQDQSGNYCSPSTQYPCVANQEYYGRGPLQISYNYNYGPAGAAIGQDLLSNPGLVSTDPVVSWQTAIWFWTTPQDPKPSCDSVMTGAWTPSAADTAANRLPGFGVTINIINGGVECGSSASSMGQSAAADRVSQFQSICTTLNTDPGSNVDCTNQMPWTS